MKIINLVTDSGYGGIQQVAHFIEHEARAAGFSCSTIALDALAPVTLNKVRRWLEIRRQLKGILRRERPDIVLSHHPIPALLVPASFAKTTVLVVHGPRWPPGSKFKENIKGAALFWAALTRSSDIVCVSTGLKGDMPSRKQRATSVIRNAPSSNFYVGNQEHTRFEYLLRFDGLRCVQFGRFCYQKNQSFSIDLLASFKSAGLKAQLVLIGSGDDYGALLAECVGKSLRCCTIGNAPFADYDVVFAESMTGLSWMRDYFDVALFPSRYEGYPLSIIEALSVGLPVVSTNCRHGPAEIHAAAIADSRYTSAAASQFRIVDIDVDRRHAQAIAAWQQQVASIGSIAREERAVIFDRDELVVQMRNKWLAFLEGFSRSRLSGGST